ncbi:hypothetical protein GV828_03050 [Flavobacterium sp. NST-5]|uniref:Uncharacterized protein n=1 Tax=Flavobacterium ichthyis TaxID=2698827 RepID=A0ABW9Z7U3_9FLAO|nr:hypothetical protein [Flavobacterium ichthyis]NBL64175.1 hypothetical protein [Flavobacterium ichthyis]
MEHHPYNQDANDRKIDNPQLNRDQNSRFDKDRNFDEENNSEEENNDNDDFLDDGFRDGMNDDKYPSKTDDENINDNPEVTKRDQKRTGNDTENRP